MPTPQARIHLCGRLRVEVEGRAREELLRGRQGRLLLALLVMRRRRPVTRDELIQALWADDAAPPRDGALSPVLSHLRRAVAPATIDGRDSLVLGLPEPAWVDVEAARAALTRAHGAQSAGDR